MAKSVCPVANLCVLYISGSECDEEGTCGDQSLSISETDQLSLCPSETVVYIDQCVVVHVVLKNDITSGICDYTL